MDYTSMSSCHSYCFAAECGDSRPNRSCESSEMWLSKSGQDWVAEGGQGNLMGDASSSQLVVSISTGDELSW